MKRTFILVALAAALVTGCGDEESGAYYQHVDTLTESWTAYRVRFLEVSTPSGDIDVTVDDYNDISATIYQTCSSKNQDDAEAHIGDINVTGKKRESTLFVTAEMPETKRRSYAADISVSTPLLDSLELRTGEGDVDIRQQHGVIAVNVQDGHVNCEVVELTDRGWIQIDVESGFIRLVLPSNASATFEIFNDDGVALINGFDWLQYDIAVENHKRGTLGNGDTSIGISIGRGDVIIEGR